jgi:hypothetical protein
MEVVSQRSEEGARSGRPPAGRRQGPPVLSLTPASRSGRQAPAGGTRAPGQRRTEPLAEAGEARPLSSRRGVGESSQPGAEAGGGPSGGQRSLQVLALLLSPPTSSRRGTR